MRTNSSKTLLTAEKAKELASTPGDDYAADCVSRVLKTIEKRAKDTSLTQEKRHRLRTVWEHYEDTDLWENGGYGKTKQWKEAKKLLENLGYTVSFYYSDGSMAVDMYTVIEW